MYKYALAKPSSYYLSQFHEENIEMEPGSHRGPSKGANAERHGSCKCGDFWIIFDGIKTNIAAELIDTAKTVLSNVVEMDRVALSVAKAEGDYEAELAYIVITEEDVEFHYYPCRVNSEWGVYFKKNEAGVWIYDDWG